MLLPDEIFIFFPKTLKSMSKGYDVDIREIGIIIQKCPHPNLCNL